MRLSRRIQKDSKAKDKALFSSDDSVLFPFPVKTKYACSFFQKKLKTNKVNYFHCQRPHFDIASSG